MLKVCALSQTSDICQNVLENGRKTQEIITSLAGFKLATGAHKHQNKA